MYAKIVLFLSIPCLLYASDQNNMRAAPPDPIAQTAAEIVRTLDNNDLVSRKSLITVGLASGTSGTIAGGVIAQSCMGAGLGFAISIPTGVGCFVALWLGGKCCASSQVEQERQRQVMNILQQKAATMKKRKKRVSDTKANTQVR